MSDGVPKVFPQQYEIRVLGRINPQWKDWFGGLALVPLHSQEGHIVTVLTGVLADQAALFGVLNRIRDLGLRLISVNPNAVILYDNGETESREEVDDEQGIG